MFFQSLTSAGDVLENFGESQKILENLRESWIISEVGGVG